MKVNEFAAQITKMEGLKKSITVAQVCEVLKLINKYLGGKLYTLIRSL